MLLNPFCDETLHLVTVFRWFPVIRPCYFSTFEMYDFTI